MSLINQVLRDLQDRQVAAPSVGLQEQIHPVRKQNHRFGLLPLLLGGFVLAASSLQISLPREIWKDRSGGTVQVPVVSEAPDVEVKTVDAGVASNRLAAVRLKSSARASRLLLEFSQTSNQIPAIQIGARMMRILLPGLIPDIETLPQPLANNPLIGHLNLLQRNQIWQLEVLFKTDVAVESLVLEADALHGERLAIDIFKQLDSTVEVVSSPPFSAADITQERKSKKNKPGPTVEKRDRIHSLQEKAGILYRQGKELAGKGQLSRAVQRWAQVLRLDPGHLQARKQLILALLPVDRRRADRLFKGGVALHKPLEFRKWYARALLPLAGPVEAASILDGVSVSSAEDAEYRALQAGLWQQGGFYPRAQIAYLELLQQFPDNGLYRFGLAVALDQQSEEISALDAYRKAVEAGLELNLQAYAQGRIKVLSGVTGAGS